MYLRVCDDIYEFYAVPCAEHEEDEVGFPVIEFDQGEWDVYREAKRRVALTETAIMKKAGII